MEQNLFKVAEVQLSYKPHFKAQERTKIASSTNAYKVFKQQWDLDRINYVEDFKILLINRNNRVLGIVNVSSGGTSATVVDPKIIFVSALKASASAIILCHNHPSGNLKPSSQDIALTKRIIDGAKLLEITMLDHLIISEDSYLSLADEGYI